MLIKTSGTGIPKSKNAVPVCFRSAESVGDGKESISVPDYINDVFDA